MTINILLNSVSDAHSIKRVSDFKANGFEVHAYGFLREGESAPDGDIEIIGSFPNSLSYTKRTGIYRKAIKKLFTDYPDNGEVWYYLGLDVALFATLVDSHRQYIYEECDLVQTYLPGKTLRSIFEWIDKRIIRKSLLTVFTSEGFKLFHYSSINLAPKNIIIAHNKLSPSIKDIPIVPKTKFDPEHLRFSFVGGIRYDSLLSVANFISTQFPNHEFHFYGFVSPKIPKEKLPQQPNILYHGRFKSPDDLPEIYSKTDILVCTYDTREENVKYAEPNKLYEALYFRCPILVSSGTFLAQEVKQMHIGYSVDPFDKEDVRHTVRMFETLYSSHSSAIHWPLSSDECVDHTEFINTIKKTISK
jgi:succinoglycan biosynthesis protein ExoL